MENKVRAFVEIPEEDTHLLLGCFGFGGTEGGTLHVWTFYFYCCTYVPDGQHFFDKIGEIAEEQRGRFLDPNDPENHEIMEAIREGFPEAISDPDYDVRKIY